MKDLCKNCGQTDLEPLYHAPAFDSQLYQSKRECGLSRCRSCKLVNTTRINMDEAADAYTAEYYGSASGKFVSIIEWALAQTSVVRARKTIQLWRGVRQPEQSPSVLDIGCGRGLLLRAFQSLGASVLGLERQEFPTDDASSDIVHIGSLSDPAYTDMKFDIIILWHVLEHLVEHERLLGEITHHQTKGGLLIIAVPNFDSLQQDIFSKYWFHLDLPRHLVHFDSNWLMQKLSERGYTIMSVSYMDPIQNIFGFIQSVLNTIAPHRLNDYYRLLKHGRRLTRNTVLPIIAWSSLAIVLLPFAILESVLGLLLRKGATVRIIAKLENEK